MNLREIVTALVEGKKLHFSGWLDDHYIELKENSLRFGSGVKAPVSLWRDFENYQDTSLAVGKWEIWCEPNTHPVGTFNWAREENKRGKHVACSKPVTCVYHPRSDFFGPSAVWSLELIDSTKWVVVS